MLINADCARDLLLFVKKSSEDTDKPSLESAIESLDYSKDLIRDTTEKLIINNYIKGDFDDGYNMGYFWGITLKGLDFLKSL